jgi:hypothetical protein
MKYNNYVVICASGSSEDPKGVSISIEQDVNRPNNPEDEELIASYMNVNYEMSTSEFKIIEQYDSVTLDKDYTVEI